MHTHDCLLLIHLVGQCIGALPIPTPIFVHSIVEQHTMTTPLSAFRASERFITASVAMNPGKGPSLTASQTLHVIQMLNNMSFDQTLGTDLLEVLAGATSPFSAGQRHNISTTVTAILDGDASVATTANRNYAKEQSHPFVYNYFPAKLWTVVKSDDTMTNKMRHVSHFLIANLGCRNASANTKRVVIATLHVASHTDPTPSDSYADLQEFAAIMKMKRDDLPGDQTLSVFPADPADFIRRFPSAYPESDPPIECPVDTMDITARSRKEFIPARSTNAKVRVTGKQPPPSTHSRLAHQDPHNTNTAMTNLCGMLSDFIMSGSAAPRTAAGFCDLPGCKHKHDKHKTMKTTMPTNNNNDSNTTITTTPHNIKHKQQQTQQQNNNTNNNNNNTNTNTTVATTNNNNNETLRISVPATKGSLGCCP
jgi:hypothetical protein